MYIRSVIISAAVLTAMSGAVPIARASAMPVTLQGQPAAPAMAVSRSDPSDQCQTWRIGPFVHTVCYRNDPAVAKAWVSDQGRSVGDCVLTPQNPTCKIKDKKYKRYEVALAKFQADFTGRRVSESFTFCFLNACQTKRHVFRFQ